MEDFFANLILSPPESATGLGGSQSEVGGHLVVGCCQGARPEATAAAGARTEDLEAASPFSSSEATSTLLLQEKTPEIT